MIYSSNQCKFMDGIQLRNLALAYLHVAVLLRCTMGVFCLCFFLSVCLCFFGLCFLCLYLWRLDFGIEFSFIQPQHLFALLSEVIIVYFVSCHQRR